MRLTLVIGSLRCGGAERVLTSLANGWRRDGHAVTVVTLGNDEEPPYFPLDPEVSPAPLGVARPSRTFRESIVTNLACVRALRRSFRQSRPDVIVSFLTRINVLVLLAALGRAVPVIVSERNHPALEPLHRAWQWLRKRLYPHADAVVVPTRRIAEWFPQRLQPRIVVIPNAVAPHGRSGPRETGRVDRGTVLGVGRLVREKGFDLLVRAFAAATRRHEGWNLVIAGEGAERAALAELAESCGVAGRVHLAGRQADIRRVYTEADIFVLPSRREGFPNVLLEAMAAGLPAVAADCPTGPREIIRGERDGLLVATENADALARALVRLIDDIDLRKRLGTEAVRVTDRYGAAEIRERWTALVSQVSRRRRHRDFWLFR